MVTKDMNPTIALHNEHNDEDGKVDLEKKGENLTYKQICYTPI